MYDMFCSRCGHKNQENFAFCGNCGQATNMVTNPVSDNPILDPEAKNHRMSIIILVSVVLWIAFIFYLFSGNTDSSGLNGTWVHTAFDRYYYEFDGKNFRYQGQHIYREGTFVIRGDNIIFTFGTPNLTQTLSFSRTDDIIRIDNISYRLQR